MGITTGIQWTERTWNPWVGCTKISPGCRECYMFREQIRYGKNPSVVKRTKTWGEPLKWQQEAEREGKQVMVFTCSWSDWFHEAADPWRAEAWDLVKRCPNLIFQILTKRAERILGHLPADWGRGYPNAWMGVSVERAEYQFRIDHLRQIAAHVRFLSLEPLLGPLTCLNLEDIHWVIVGGESGDKDARPMHPLWPRMIRDDCQAAAVPFFFKQWGEYAPMDALPPLKQGESRKFIVVKPDGSDRLFRTDGKFSGDGPEEGDAWMVRVGKKAAGRLLDGREWNEFPEVKHATSK